MLSFSFDTSSLPFWISWVAQLKHSIVYAVSNALDTSFDSFASHTLSGLNSCEEKKLCTPDRMEQASEDSPEAAPATSGGHNGEEDGVTDGVKDQEPPSDDTSVPPSEELRKREDRIARKRQIKSLEALEEGVKMQRLVLEELKGLRSDLRKIFNFTSAPSDVVQPPQSPGSSD